MNLFRSEEHVKRWPLYFHAVDDYVMSVADWAEVFSTSMFRKRLDRDYLLHSQEYLEDYRLALLDKGKAIPSPDRVLSTVMFTDIVDSTVRAAELGDEKWRSLLERHNEIASPTRAIRCAVAIRDATSGMGLQVRIGIHSGECEVFGDDIGGIAVHIGARVAAAAGAEEILVTGAVMESVTGSGIDFTNQGSHDLKGVPGSWRLHGVVTPT
jgi:class 3 adenylate cyclase